ncbi:hypothetical protein Poli38472_003377 [Pythium oligandrum]|uniref:Uncharacterized protein n=1 Tax=Pythium oligandrum TaxID=41045 RepID=A0A8K1FFA0_PYTOL|nr:hypothetical protein Poli38472_003377 [Pythium oligandrum]|eukprot:TMW57452.1 hypothetical protein Poli38472_003377 [Pythium oligandrum]
MLARLRASALTRVVDREMKRRFIGGFAHPADALAPTVAEKIVNVVLVDYEGNRHFVQGRVGQSLRDACALSNVGLVKDDSNGGGGSHSAVRADYYTESLFGEGAVSPQSHVIIANEWVSKLPPPNDQELHILDGYVPALDRSANSRLGTEIILSKDLDGLVVAVPEAPPVETYQYVHQFDDEDEDEEEQ